MLESQSVTLLHVEDDEICQMMLSRSFRLRKIVNPIVGACDGIDALELLRGTNGRERLPRPFMIVLDLNMPRMNGMEFLKELRKDKALKQSIVFVLSTSDADNDKVGAYNLGVAGYILKSNPANAFAEITVLLADYLRVVEFPPE